MNKAFKFTSALLAVIFITIFMTTPPRFGKLETVESKLSGKDDAQRANIKAGEIVKLGPVAKTYNKRYDLDIEIIDLTQIDKGVVAYVKAWNKNGPVVFESGKTVEKVTIINPPIKIPDGTRKTEVIDGVEYVTDNFKEDLKGALIESLAHTIKVITK